VANVTALVCAMAAGASGCSARDSAAASGDKPRTPIPLEPANASYTGSARTPALESARPAFIWTWVDHGDAEVTYELDVDDDCTPGNLQQCEFASPEIREVGLTRARYRPAIPLGISAELPFGRRYYWRVRACAGEACSAWSRVRYVEVGRIEGDFNGDGYSDIVITAPLIDLEGVDRGSAFVYYGGRDGVSADHVSRLDDPQNGDSSSFGVSAAIAGDVDADGYADLVIGAAGTREHRGIAYVFHGGPTGIESIPRIDVRDSKGQLGDWFGASVAGVSDVDGDGYADVLVGASGADRDGVDWGVTYLYRGTRDGITRKNVMRITSPLPRDYDHFGYSLAPAGDVNGDGYADLAIGSPGIDLAGMYNGVDRGAVYIFHGGPDGPSKIPGARLEAPVPLDFDRFGFAVGTAGDVNGDGFDDVIIGAPGVDSPQPDGGVAYVFAGTMFGVNPTPQTVLEDPRIEVFDRFGTSAASAGDVNRDGFDDVIIGTSGSERGRGLVFHGSREGIDPMPGAVLHDPLGEGYNHFADAVAGAGDINGDGFDDVIIGASGSDNGGVFRGSAVLYPGTPDGIDPNYPLRVDNPDTGEHDHFGHVVAGR
jgi:hypothetical protein